MSSVTNPAKPGAANNKFSPQNVSESGPDKGRQERNMDDLWRGSEGDIRRKSGNRND